MTDGSSGTAILIHGRSGQASCDELARLAAIGEAPRTDYVELARVLDADVIDDHYMDRRATPLARGLGGIGTAQAQVLEVLLRRRYHRILAWHDRFGLMLGMLLKPTRARRDVVLISAYSTSPLRSLFIRSFRAHPTLRALAVESSAQLQIAADRLRIPAEKLHLYLPGVDERFWFTDRKPADNLICSVGSEARDYGTLAQAVTGLDIKVELVPGSAPIAALPPNVHVRERLSWLGLRHLYTKSRFVVIPTRDVEYNAGITALKEAMAMGRAVIISRSRGQLDYVRDGISGIYVPPEDPAALRSAIQHLIDHPEEAERMGRAGRAFIEERHALDASVARLAAIVRGTSAGAEADADEARTTKLLDARPEPGGPR